MMRILLALLAAVLLTACQPSERTLFARAAAGGADLEAGRKVYNFRCYYCHGYSGDARTLAASFLASKPRDFTAPEAAHLTREAMIQAIRDGREGTAMAAFADTLTATEIAAVTDFIRDEFVRKKAVNTRYHTPENGWAGHERYRAAFPFATGEIALDAPDENLTSEQTAGRRLFMATCMSCHDRGRVTEDGVTWQLHAVSYPPNVDACDGCHRYSAALKGHPAALNPQPAGSEAPGAAAKSPFERHDVTPRLSRLTAREQRGERVFQQNCTFCHAADGSGKNWIGVFLEPHPRDLADPGFLSRMTRKKLAAAIREGVPGTSMPAWKNVLKEEEVAALVAYLARAFGPLGD